MRIIITAALITGLAGCSTNYYPPVAPATPAQSTVTEPGPGQGYDQARGEAFKGTYEPYLQQQQMAAKAEYRARAECSMRAQEANSNNFGLIHGFFAGLGAGSACVQYYQKLGIIQ